MLKLSTWNLNENAWKPLKVTKVSSGTSCNSWMNHINKTISCDVEMSFTPSLSCGHRVQTALFASVKGQGKSIRGKVFPVCDRLSCLGHGRDHAFLFDLIFFFEALIQECDTLSLSCVMSGCCVQWHFLESKGNVSLCAEAWDLLAAFPWCVLTSPVFLASYPQTS